MLTLQAAHFSLVIGNVTVLTLQAAHFSLAVKIHADFMENTHVNHKLLPSPKSLVLSRYGPSVLRFWSVTLR